MDRVLCEREKKMQFDFSLIISASMPPFRTLKTPINSAWIVPWTHAHKKKIRKSKVGFLYFWSLLNKGKVKQIPSCMHEFMPQEIRPDHNKQNSRIWFFDGCINQNATHRTLSGTRSFFSFLRRNPGSLRTREYPGLGILDIKNTRTLWDLRS